MENKNEIPDEHTSDDNLLDESDDNGEPYSSQTPNGTDTTHVKNRTRRPGRPPLGPQVAKLHQDLSEARNEITALREEIDQLNAGPLDMDKQRQDLSEARDEITRLNKQIDQLNIDLTITTEQLRQLRQQQPVQNQEQIRQINAQLTEQKNDNEIKAEQIMTMTESNLKQGKKITQLLMSNQKLKAANDNLIERLATNELNHNTLTSQQQTINTEILMIGDSNARRLEQILSKNPNFTLKLHQIATLRKALTDIRSNNLPPQWEENQIVLLLLGTNDIQNGTKARQTQQMTIELAKAIIEKGKKVIVSEIPPFREDIQHEMEAKIHNKMISTIPSTSPFITLLSYREQIAEYPDQETFTDHVHLDPNSQAAQTIAQLIAQHITSLDVAPILTQQSQIPPKPTELFATTTDHTATNTRPYTRTFTVPKDQAGLVIGVRQQVLNRLKDKHQIEINYMSARNADPIFKLEGQRNNVTKAEEEIHRLAASKNDQPPHQRTKPQSNQSSTDCNCDNCRNPQQQCRNFQQQQTPTPTWADQATSDPWNQTPTPRGRNQSPACKKAKY